MRRLAGVLLILLMACQGLSAQSGDPNDPKDPNYPQDPNELIRSKWRAVISILSNKDIDQEAREKRIDKIVSPIFDFPLMAKLSLGREHWTEMTAAQQKKFTELFIKRLKASYREKIALYTDQKIEFKPGIRKKNIIQIPLELISKDKKIQIIHKLRKAGKRWKVYDVEIQGVSILLTYRSQFDDILSKGTVEDLLARLEKPSTE
jgi:phospholipid transport system substrate-binding protein